jgi:D-alanine-D-alanine ligase
MRIGIAFDLRPEVSPVSGPDDLFEEYDSEATVAGIASALQASGHDAVLLGGSRRLIESLLSDPPDLVFNIAEGQGSRSREAHVPAVCEMLGVPYTHSDPLTLAACLDKSVAKSLIANAGVPTPEWWVLDGPSVPVIAPYPVVAKPLAEGSSIGVRASSRVLDAEAMREEAMRLLVDYRQPVLVETFLSGPEFTVGIIGTGSAASVLGVMEIVPRSGTLDEFIYSVDVKRLSDAGVEYQTPPQRPSSLVDQVAQVALRAFRTLGCRDIGRVDIRCDAAGTPHFLDLNPLPGLKPGWGDLVLLAVGAGWTYDALIARIVDEACCRLGLG